MCVNHGYNDMIRYEIQIPICIDRKTRDPGLFPTILGQDPGMKKIPYAREESLSECHDRDTNSPHMPATHFPLR